MLRMFIPVFILLAWALSSSANEEKQQHDDEGITNASRSSYFNKFICQDVSPQILTPLRLKDKCHKACRQDSYCSGFHFDRGGMCTVYSTALKDSSTIHCAKTTDILGTARIFSCAPGNTRSFTHIKNFRTCKKKCKQDKCYGFEYDNKEGSCDVFMFGDANRTPFDADTVPDGIRCDKQKSMFEFLKCPCFSNNEVENTVIGLTQGTMAASLDTLSCQRTSEGSYGIYYTDDVIIQADRIFNSFSVGGRDLNQVGTCTKDNTSDYIAREEEDVCLRILQNSCKTLDDRKVSLDGTCPCYNEDDLNIAVASINDGLKKLRDGACKSTKGSSISFFYEATPSNTPVEVEGYSVYTSQVSRKCTFGGDIKLQNISRQSAVHCSRLIEDACLEVVR